MAYNFRPYNPKQPFLLPPNISDWVPEEHLARFISDLVDHLQEEARLEAFYTRYRADGWGNSAYHPRMMLKVLLYGYCIGVRSARGIARALVEDVAFRFLSANQHPDFRTVARFRETFRGEIEGLFVEVLRLCREAGLARMGRVALDGRKVAGNAALDQNRTRDGIEEEVARILAEAKAIDEEEDRRYGEESSGEELPEELRTKKGRLERLKAARRKLEEQERQAREEQQEKIRQREEQAERRGKRRGGRPPKDPEEVVKREAKANVTDPESRILKTEKGFLQGYNGQAMGDCESQVVLAADIHDGANDYGALRPMLERCEKQAGRRPAQLTADAGYCSEENLALETKEMELFIATRNERRQVEEAASQPVPRGRIPKGLSLRERMARKLRTKGGKAAYGQRKTTIEPIFGQMAMRGLNRFWVRGKEKVRAEWTLWCTTHNILKLWRSFLWLGMTPREYWA